MKKICFCILTLFLLACFANGQSAGTKPNRLDTIFGSNTIQRAWWDVQRYDITVAPEYATKTLRGKTTITYRVLPDQKTDYLQIDLQKPMVIDSIYYNGKMYINYPARPYYNEGGHWFIPLPKEQAGSVQSVSIVYHGKPKEATNAPWEGGWVWSRDKKGRPWMSVACEDDGASLWYPCKDLWSDEPDKGASLTVIVDDTLVAVGNGRLKNKAISGGKASYSWEVTAPINTYNIVPYIGSYTSWRDTLAGEGGNLDLRYWVLDYELAKAKNQFSQVKPALRSFEYWFGAYPFYEDGFQLVQAPYLGMEHQSAVAYGNEFMNGYLGNDLSGSGWGLKWDYIIVHESGHEWFGNNITAKDMADMWVHEAFTTYSETLFTESNYGKKAADEYTAGLRKNIANDRPIIGQYNIRKEGSGDMYFKGSNIIHTIRQVINDDNLFRQILRGLNKDFYRQTVTTSQVEEYIATKSGKNLRMIFDQYLRTVKIPVLEYKQAGNAMQYRWANTVPGFTMPLRLASGQWITPTASWQRLQVKSGKIFSVDKNFYINTKKL